MGARASTSSRTGGLSLDPDLRMIHLHRMDYAICLARHQPAARRCRGTSATLAEGWAAHNLIAAEDGVRALVLLEDRNLRGRARSWWSRYHRVWRTACSELATSGSCPAGPVTARPCARPGGDLRQPDQWQRVTLNRSVAASHRGSLGPASRSAAEISGDAYASLARGPSYDEPHVPASSTSAPRLAERRQVRRRAVRAGPRARGRSMCCGGKSARSSALPADT